MAKSRNYEKENKWQSSEEQKKRRAARGRARYALMKKGRVTVGDGKDVHHKDGNPHNNSKANLSVTSSSRNKSMNKKGPNSKLK